METVRSLPLPGAPAPNGKQSFRLTPLQAETLVSVWQAIAGVRDRKELFATIFARIQPVIPVDDTGILVLDQTCRYWQDWTNADNYQETDTAARLQQLGYDQWQPMDRFTEYTLQHTGIMTVAGFRQQYPGHPFGPVMWEAGLREMMFTPLVTGGRKLGTLFFDSGQEGTYTQEHLPLFKAIADLIAAAVANILANEEMLEREREKNVLLSLSETLAIIRDKQQLLKVVFEQVRPLFSFYDVGLFVLDQERQYIEDWTVTLPQVNDSEANLLLRAHGAGRIPFAGSAMEWAIEQLRQSKSPAVFSYTEDLLRQFPEYPQFSVIKQIGYKESIGTLLRTDKGELGILFFNALSEGHFRQDQFTLFQAIADQVSVAVANILANEEILEREREKAMLLEVGEAIASIRDREELFTLIVEKVQPLFGFNQHTNIAIYQPESHSLRMFFTRMNARERAESQIPKFMTFPVEGIFQTIIDAQEVIITDERWKTSPKTAPIDEASAQIWRDLDFKYALSAALRSFNQMIGTFHVHFNEPKAFTAPQLRLFKAIADQIAVAVANILANEEILEREREKAILLSVSGAIAKVQNRSALLKAIYEQVAPLLPHKDIGLFLVDEEEDQHWEIIDKSALAVEFDQIVWKKYGKGPFKHRGSGVDLLMNGPVILSIDDLADCHHPCIPVMKEIGFKEFLGGPLVINSRKRGMFCFNADRQATYSAKDFPLFQGILDQLSVALANILANEEILEREREKSLQVALTNALTVLPTWEERFGMVAQLLHEAVPFDLLSVSFRDLTRPRAYSYLKQADGRLALHTWEDYQRKTGLTLPEFLEHRQQLQEHFAQAGLYVGETHAQACRRYVLKGLMERHYGVRSSVVIPLEMESGAEGDCVLTLSSRQPDGFTGQQFALLREVAPQIALATEKGMAYDDIQAREREKALQVSLTDALTQNTDWERKLLQVVRLLAAHIPFDYVALGFERPGGTGKGYSFSRTGPDEYQLVTAEDFFRLARITPEQYAKLRTEINYAGPLLLNGDEFARFCRQYKLKRLMADAFRLQSNLVLPINLGRKHWFILSLFSRQPAPYGAHHLELLRKMQSSLALVLDKLLAYEEIEALSEQLKQENTYLQEEVQTQYNFGEIVGASQSLQPVLKGVSLVAPTDATVLVLGETGTGKELVARAIHGQSKRRSRPLIKLNCAALPTQLIESELFGHEKGSFTGATERRIGKFELAKDGTIFLDEIGELPLESQCKLLRVLQEGEFERLGGNHTIKANVRVIAATNRDLEKEVAEGRFRADLYFRLSIFPLRLPPLRERREDIPLLAAHFLRKSAAKLGRQFKGIALQAMQEMMVYGWPGNIRELEHVLEQAMIVSPGKLVELARPLRVGPGQVTRLHTADEGTIKTIDDNERDHILKVLKLTSGRIRGVGGAAELLDIIPTTLEGRMRKLGIKKEHTVRKK